MQITFGKKLLQIRKKRGLTQLQMATAIGVPEQNYRLYEHDRCLPKINVLLKIAIALQIDPLVFAECQFKGQGCPLEQTKQYCSKTMLKRIYGELRLKGIHRVVSRTVECLRPLKMGRSTARDSKY